jgi:ubiquinone biosynthesis protein
MMRLIRLLTILIISLKYGLEEFLFGEKFKQVNHILGKILFFRVLKESRAVRLRIAFEHLGPIFVKFGQILSTRRDLIPVDIADELAKLQDQVPAFGFNEVEKIITETYQKPLLEVFSEFNETPIASASVAQVHFATLQDGRKVAVKILRPNIQRTIRHDIQLLDSVAWLLEKILRDGDRLKPRAVVADFARHLDNELDLTIEAANCSVLKQNFNNSPLLIVPEVYWDWCYPKVMVMERMDGIPISQISQLKALDIDLKKLAKNGVEIFFTQVFRDGFFHADMHPGNIQVSKDGRYIALDFGIMGKLTEKDKQYLARNFLAFFKRDYREVALAHVESGWVASDISIEEFEMAIRSVCEPIFNKPLKDISFGRVLIRLFHTSRKFGLIIQPQLTLLQKTLLNVEGLGRELDPELDLWQTAQPVLERWASEKMGVRSIWKKTKEGMSDWLALLPTLPSKIEAYLTRDETRMATLSQEVHTLKVELKKSQERTLIAIAVCTVLFLYSVWQLL